MVVTVLCDLGVKYLSKVYNHNWLQEQGRVSLREWETLVTQDLPPLGVPRLLSDNHMPEPFNKREVLSRVLEDALEVNDALPLHAYALNHEADEAAIEGARLHEVLRLTPLDGTTIL